MGKATKALKEFIDDIPDSKLTGFSTASGTIHKTTEFRLDMQGVRNSTRFGSDLDRCAKPALVTLILF